MNGKADTIRAKLMLGALGLVLSIFGYFLIDRDVEFRSSIANFQKELKELAIESGRNNVSVDELARRIERVENTQTTRGERISRLEALIERLAEKQK